MMADSRESRHLAFLGCLDKRHVAMETLIEQPLFGLDFLPTLWTYNGTGDILLRQKKTGGLKN
jgi:hypothetical protein